MEDQDSAKIEIEKIDLYEYLKTDNMDLKNYPDFIITFIRSLKDYITRNKIEFHKSFDVLFPKEITQNKEYFKTSNEQNSTFIEIHNKKNKVKMYNVNLKAVRIKNTNYKFVVFNQNIILRGKYIKMTRKISQTPFDFLKTENIAEVKICNCDFQKINKFECEEENCLTQNLKLDENICEAIETGMKKSASDFENNKHQILTDEKKYTSVSEPITDYFKNFFGASSVIFSGLGREDTNVRMIEGRPFFLTIVNPIKNLQKIETKKLEESLNLDFSWENKIFYKNLRIANKKQKKDIFLKEFDKIYGCLIFSEKNIENKTIEDLNSIKLQILQKTPLRVLHRRPNIFRERQIEILEIEKIGKKNLELDQKKEIFKELSEIYKENNIYYIKLKAQSGTYIKEFIHSDHGRTVPSIKSLFKSETDILFLDVIEILVE